jgi:hypothetical protein
VSLGFKSTDRLRALRTQPASWSLGLPVENPGVWLWSTAAAKAALGDPPGFSHPPCAAELEDFVEVCAKALRAGESLPLRVAARAVGEAAPPLVRDLNEPLTVRSRVDAVRAAISLEIAPSGWAEQSELTQYLHDGTLERHLGFA